MKVQIEIDCSPQEARAFMGLPDISKANEAYVDTMTTAMKGVTNPAQLQDFAKQLAPMGQIGMKLFQNFVEGASAAGAAAQSTTKPGGKSKS